MKKLERELKKINKEIAIIVSETMMKKQNSCERKLWIRKKEILAKLNPLNA